MKKFVVAAALTAFAGAAFAGGMSEPVMEAEVVTEVVEAAAAGSSSGGGLIVPLLILALIAAAAS